MEFDSASETCSTSDPVALMSPARSSSLILLLGLSTGLNVLVRLEIQDFNSLDRNADSLDPH
jgi:hypothetical protein